MNEQELGMVAEIEFKKRAVYNGFIVSKVINDRGGYDFIIDCGDRLSKIQVKSTGYLELKGRSNPSYSVVVKKSVRGNRVEYDKSDYDFLAIYIHDFNLIYIIPIDEVPSKIRIFPNSRASKYNKYIDAWDLIRM